MDYEHFRSVMDHHILDRLKADLLKNVGENPERFVGLFRATKPTIKIHQHLLQSREIRFGDAMEAIVKEYVAEMEFENLSALITYDDGSKLNVDQLFQRDGRIWFVEQKVRDDHDSTKKRGQLENYKKKALTLRDMFDQPIAGIMYFIDPSFTKNMRYYKPEVEMLGRELNMEMNIFYGREFFDYFGHPQIWEEMLGYLRRWKREMPDFLMPNFDIDVEKTIRELQGIEAKTWNKVAAKSELWDEGIVKALFPTGEALRAIAENLERSPQVAAIQAARQLHSRIATYYV